MRQVLLLVPQGLFPDSLQLHRIILTKAAGAISLSVAIGVSMLAFCFHPQFSTFWSNSSSNNDQFKTWKCVLNPWKYAALSLGGSFSGQIIPLHAMLMYLSYLKGSR